MAKKMKRKVSQVKDTAGKDSVVNTMNTAPVSEQAVVQAGSVSTPAAQRSSFSRRSVTTTPAEFNPDYTYVVNDLKRIGTLAGIFFIILVALAFIIR